MGRNIVPKRHSTVIKNTSTKAQGMVGAGDSQGRGLFFVQHYCTAAVMAVYSNMLTVKCNTKKELAVKCNK